MRFFSAHWLNGLIAGFFDLLSSGCKLPPSLFSADKPSASAEGLFFSFPSPQKSFYFYFIL